MKIWLNWFAAQYVRHHRACEAQEGRECTLKDNDIFRAAMVEGARMWKQPAIQTGDSERSARAWFANLVTPLIGEGEHHVPPLAIRIDQAPAFDRPADYSDDEVVAEGRKILSRHSVVYVDLGERVFMMSGGIFQVRALFAWREGPFNRFCAVLTRSETNRGWRLIWREGRHRRDPRNSAYDDVWTPNSTDIHDPSRPINFRRVDYEKLADVETMFWLALICWRHLTDNAVPPMPAEPLPPHDAEVLPLEWRDDNVIAGGGPSLFRTIAMPAIDEYRISMARQGFPRQTHKMSRHEVAAHPRWQACGKGLKERRRIWIASHERGSGPAKIPLHALPADPDPIGWG